MSKPPTTQRLCVLTVIAIMCALSGCAQQASKVSMAPIDTNKDSEISKEESE